MKDIENKMSYIFWIIIFNYVLGFTIFRYFLGDLTASNIILIIDVIASLWCVIVAEKHFSDFAYYKQILGINIRQYMKDEKYYKKWLF
jgi:hypothetical protein